jgi:hypothetical protein
MKTLQSGAILLIGLAAGAAFQPHPSEAGDGYSRCLAFLEKPAQARRYETDPISIGAVLARSVVATTPPARVPVTEARPLSRYRAFPQATGYSYADLSEINPTRTQVLQFYRPADSPRTAYFGWGR